MNVLSEASISETDPRLFVQRSSKLITGPPTHSVAGQTSNGRWRLASLLSVVCRRL